jgi:AmmeMemoRadiSam system protein B/AmmeMemoRadiSam system protein A
MKRRGTILAIAAALIVAACGCRSGSRPTAPGTPAASAAPAAAAAEAASQIREPAVAGPPGQGFYPSDPEALRQQVQGFLKAARPPTVPGELIAILAPHAGYEYSGPVAAHAFKLLEGKRYDTVVLIGLSHRVPCDGFALSDATAWRTPLGDVTVDTEFGDALVKACSRVRRDALPHAEEHCLEVQLPFLQETLKTFKIVPLVTQYESLPECLAVAEAIAAQIQAEPQKKILLVASSDLAHFPPQKECAKADHRTLDAIGSLDPQRLVAVNRELLSGQVPGLECSACAFGAVMTTMVAAKKLGADKAVELNYGNTATTHPELANRCVGYGAVAFVRTKAAKAPVSAAAKPDEIPADQELGKSDQIALLKLARKTLEQVFTGEQMKPVALDPKSPLSRDGAAFVTLTNKGRLRGCIGSIEAQEPLIQCVQRRTVDAATRDRRFAFDPVTKEELPQIEIEISVLSPMHPIKDPSTIVVGKHGVMVEQNGQSGLYLPQVATEQGWTREEMLNSLCEEKAGLPRDAWKTGAALFVFTAQHFSESKLGLRK